MTTDQQTNRPTENTEINFEELKNKTFDSNQDMLSYLQSLGCDINRIKTNVILGNNTMSKNNILYYPAGGHPNGFLYELSEITTEGKIIFNFIAKSILKSIIRDLQKDFPDEIYHTSITSQITENNTTIKNLHQQKKDAFKLFESMTLMDDELCGVLKAKDQGRGWYLDMEHDLIKEKNKSGYSGSFINIITKTAGETLLINKKYKENKLVIARIEKGEIVELLTSSLGHPNHILSNFS